MQEVRVESLERLERRGVLLSANAGSSSIDFPEEAWDRATGTRRSSRFGARCTAGRFEMPPGLWRVLSGGLGWRDVQTFVNKEE